MGVLRPQHGVFAFASLGLQVVVSLILRLVAVIEGNESRRRYFEDVDELDTEGKALFEKKVSSADNDKFVPGTFDIWASCTS